MSYYLRKKYEIIEGDDLCEMLDNKYQLPFIKRLLRVSEENFFKIQEKIQHKVDMFEGTGDCYGDELHAKDLWDDLELVDLCWNHRTERLQELHSWLKKENYEKNQKTEKCKSPSSSTSYS